MPNPPANDFWSRVEKQPNGCWYWSGKPNPGGYGRVWCKGKTKFAHRIAWELTHHTTLPTFMRLRHTCDHPQCCNPAHLKLGNHLLNMRDVRERRRRCGERNANASLNESKVIAIRSRYALGETQAALALAYGITQSMISKVVRGENWAFTLPKDASVESRHTLASNTASLELGAPLGKAAP